MRRSEIETWKELQRCGEERKKLENNPKHELKRERN
jgi:hypothetical protein